MALKIFDLRLRIDFRLANLRFSDLQSIVNLRSKIFNVIVTYISPFQSSGSGAVDR